MNSQQIISKCNQIRNGSFFRMQWNTNCDKKLTAAARREGYVVTKDVTCVCRKGIGYTNIKKVRDNKEKTGQFVVDPLTGAKTYTADKRSWAHDIVPNLLIQHNTNGKIYMIVYTSENAPKVQYYLNGKPIEWGKLHSMGIMQESYWIAEKSPVMTIPIESIRSIGKENAQ